MLDVVRLVDSQCGGVHGTGGSSVRGEWLVRRARRVMLLLIANGLTTFGLQISKTISTRLHTSSRASALLGTVVSSVAVLLFLCRSDT